MKEKEKNKKTTFFFDDDSQHGFASVSQVSLKFKPEAAWEIISLCIATPNFAVCAHIFHLNYDDRG